MIAGNFARPARIAGHETPVTAAAEVSVPVVHIRTDHMLIMTLRAAEQVLSLRLSHV
jgi:hypothetical protein